MNIRTALFFLILIPVMLFGMLLGIVLNAIDGTGDRFHRVATLWGRFSAWVFGIEVTIEGEENYQAGEIGRAHV